MNLDYYNEDIIDAFLNAELSAEKMAAVQAKIAVEPAYAEAVDLQKNLREALKLQAIREQMKSITSSLETEGFYEEAPEDELEQKLAEAIKEQKVHESVSEISEELEQEGFYDKKEEASEAPDASGGGGKVRSLFNMRYVGLAASVLLVIGAFYLMIPKAASSDVLYSSYFSPAQEDVSEDLELLLEGQAFASNKEELLEIKEGLKAYVGKNYHKAATVFEAWLAKDSKTFDQHQLRFLLAMSQMALDKTKAAIQNLTLLKEVESFDKKEAVLWYLALAYLKLEDHVQAKSYLEAVKDSPLYGPAARDLLKVKLIEQSGTMVQGEGLSVKEEKLHFGLKDITKLSLTVNRDNGKIGLLNEGKAMPANIEVAEISVDVFDGDAYSGSFLLQGSEPLAVEEIMPEEVLIFNLVTLRDTETNETAAWERVPHQWVEDNGEPSAKEDS